ncbi:NADP-dependent 3-hydroxy acid dehydrogenase YdfG [Pedobacter westerhofensis]|uniref:NADP-dependent 3-hydroxy acid dehydrogenase YdfG n=1 Tax=Pedobacter westerhofensis TaxID=425512 RepID=A0A521AAV2_9SPHI|nr:SDR family oxidoreductase [Pedobacter westerhofensis]SMO31943.1 NADP-dependent 3-hydroxy acid dehydrogenase YdfG [Pedobacter westerhofensis]
MKTVFITGTSSGIGKATTKLFASQGWHVIATMRKPENETELNQLENVTLLPLDVNDYEQINETVKSVTEKYDIDVVFNNAGYSLMGPLEGFTDEQIVQQIQTNLFGVVRITKAFIPYFRAKKRGLFLSTGSLAGLVAFPLGSMYDASKFAINGFNESLAYELAQFNIGVKLILPGLTATDLLDKSPYVTYPGYEGLSDWFEKAFVIENATKSTDIAEVVYEAATDGSSKLRYLCGADTMHVTGQIKEIGVEAFIENMHKSLKDTHNS